MREKTEKERKIVVLGLISLFLMKKVSPLSLSLGFERKSLLSYSLA
jgi:hypothetical protein